LPSFRATVRWVTDRQRYHVEDVEADDLAAALTQLHGRLPADVVQHADLLELRRHQGQDERPRGPE
jgi:hypothetical protein